MDTRDDPERAAEHDVREFEHDIERLEGHIEEAHREAGVRGNEASDEAELVDVAGDWEGKARTDQDPSGIDAPGGGQQGESD